MNVSEMTPVTAVLGEPDVRSVSTSTERAPRTRPSGTNPVRVTVR